MHRSVSQSNNDFQNLMNSTDIGTLFLDRALRIMLFTPRARDIFSLMPADVGRPFTDITNKLGDEDLIANVELVLEKLHTLEREVRTNDGQAFLMQISPYRTSEDRINGVVLTFVDITRRKRVEEQLRESEERFRGIVNQAAAGIGETDLTGKFTLVNDRFSEITGYSRQELLGMRLHDITHPDDLPRNVELFQKCVAEGTPFAIEKRYVRKDGSTVWVNNSVSVVRDADGKPRYALAVSVDITERKQAVEELRQSEERYRTLFESIDDGFCIVEMIFDDAGKPEDYRFLETNPAFEKATGLENVTGKTARQLVPNLEQWWVETYGTVALTGEGVRFENYSAPMNRWFDVYASRVGDGEGRKVAIVFTNITERKRMENVLRESEERLRLLVESTKDYAIFTLDLERRVSSWNSGAEATFGYTEAEILGQPGDILFTPEDRRHNAPEAEVQTALAEGRASDERWHIRKDGTRFYASGVMTLLRDGEVKGFVKIARDLTERKQMEEALRESEARFRAMFEQANVGIARASFDGRLLAVNPGFSKIVGYAEDEARRLTVRDVTHPDDYEAEEALTQQLVAGEIPGFSMEKRYIRKDGQIIWGNMTATLVRDALGEPLYALVIVEDITERKEAEKALRRAHDELEERVNERTVELLNVNETLLTEVHERVAAEERARHLMRQIVTAQEDERRRVARDLHDQLGQQLTGLRLKLESHKKRRCVDDTETCEEIEEIQSLAKRIDDEVDFLAWELRPVSLDELGLATALATFVREWSKHFGIPAEFHTTDSDQDRLPPEAEINFYRIAQEALNNIYKHARASNVDVIFERRDLHATLIIEDNGRGFDASEEAQTDNKQIGLINMRERASFVGGTLEIESQPGGGTTVFARVPVRQNDRAKERNAAGQ